MDYIIETENLTKRYGTATVVDKVNLHVPKGKIYGFLGRNGAGKTTAMKMMLQLAFPTEGTVRLFGTNYKENIHTLYSKVGSIIETPGFYSNLTGYENLQILAKLRGGVSKSGVEKALEVVGLHKEKRKVFSDYSLGMKQRLGIAAAIMHEPELLILDEPINGLDPIGIVEIRSFLSELSHNHGITIFISSHVLSEIEQIADIIGVMHEGHLVEEVNISELHKRNRKYIQFDLSDSEIAGKILENHYHMTDFTVQDGTVRIYDFTTMALSDISYKTAILIGAFQVLSLIPGTSRSGATIIGALLIGVSRVAAAEFTFFLAVPTMLGASAFKLLKFGFEFTSAELLALVLGMAVAFAVSVLVIKFLMNFIKKHDFKVFGWYRIVLGILVVLIKS